MSRRTDRRIRLIHLGRQLAAAALLAGCVGGNPPVGSGASVDAGGGATAGGSAAVSGDGRSVDAGSGVDSRTPLEALPTSSERCKGAAPELIDGKPTGYVRCDGAYFHRAEKRECPSGLPRQQLPHPPGPNVDCSGDGDCTAHPHGYCQAWTTFAGKGYACVYGCLKDEDCGPGQICRCGDPVGRCVPATCATDADCGPGLLCANSGVSSCARSFACQKASDRCDSSANCARGQYCQVEDTGRTCSERPADSDC